MAKKKNGIGRPKETDKVQTEYVYLRQSQKKKILSKYKTLTKALTEGVLAEC